MVIKLGERSPFRSIFDCLEGKGMKSKTEVTDCSLKLLGLYDVSPVECCEFFEKFKSIP